MTYRKLSSFPFYTPYPFMLCVICGEIFENDTTRDHLYCPKDNSMLLACDTEESAIVHKKRMAEFN